MQPRLTGINRNETLIYLGYKGGEIPAGIMEDIRRCESMLLEIAHARIVWRIFDLLPDGTLSGTNFTPGGDDVRRLLQDCSRVILVAATLGAEVDAMLRRVQIQNMGKAVILDACANSAIENVCDNLCDDIAKVVSPFYLTDRFSPGYGDLPFSHQEEFCRILDLPRRIGVSLSPGGVMIPQKSVTALMGIADRPQKKRFRGCISCNLFQTCAYRKDGRTCENI